jgi:hypothetical protein
MMKNKNTLVTSFLILFNLIVICFIAGAILKLNHLQYGDSLVFSGLGLFVFVFIPLLIRLNKKAIIRIHTKNLLLIIFSFIAVFMVYSFLSVKHVSIFPGKAGISLLLIPVISILFLHKVGSVSEKTENDS